MGFPADTVLSLDTAAAEYVANQWRQEQAGGSAKKRQDVFKDGLRTRPDLVLCLLRDVPSWTPASMTDEQKGACLSGGHLYCAANHAHDSDPQAAVASNRVVLGFVGALAMACFSVQSLDASARLWLPHAIYLTHAAQLFTPTARRTACCWGRRSPLP